MGKFLNILEKINFDIKIGSLNLNILSLNMVDENPEWYVPEHLHTSFEFHIIPRGKGYINIEDTEFTVNGGELFITGPMLRHSQISDKTSPMVEYCLECEISISENGVNDYTYDEGIFLKEVLSKKFPYAFKDIYNTAQTFEKIFDETENKENSLLLIVRNLIEKIVLDLFKTVCSAENISNSCQLTENSKDYNRIQRLIKYIDANYKNNINIDDVAKVLFLSPRQIDRVMKKTFNQSFHNYLLMHRMHIAEKLLMNTTIPIEDVAYKAGFSSHYYMYQAFKRRGKPTPGQYRYMS